MRTRRTSRLDATFLVVVALALASPAFPGDGRTPVYPTAPPTTVTIASPGSYYLTDDFDYSSFAGTAIMITTDHVTLDLAGHTIITRAGAADYAIRIRDSDGIVVHDGRVQNGLVFLENNNRPRVSIDVLRLHIATTASAGNGGIQAWNGSGSGVLSLRLDGNKVECLTSTQGLNLQDTVDSVISNNSIANCNFAIYAQGSTNVVFESNQLTKSATGLYLSGSANRCRVVDNLITECTGDGIYITGAYNYLADNLTASNGRFGIHLAGGAHGNMIQHNATSGNADCGIAVGGSENTAMANNTPDNGPGCTATQSCTGGLASSTGITNGGSANLLCMNIP